MARADRSVPLVRYALPILAGLALLLSASLAAAGALTGPREDTAPATHGAHAAPGPVAVFGRWIVATQREFTRGMAREMRAVADSPAALPAALGLAFLYGMFHAVGPGHGKGVILGYFLSKRAGLRRGLLMGLRISLLHVLSATLLALLAKSVLDLALAPGAAAEVQWLERVSYGLVMAIGALLSIGALRRLAGGSSPRRGRLAGHALPLAAAPGADGMRIGVPADRRQEGIVALAVGLVPCTGALLVLVYAIGRDTVLLGLAMVAAIGAGMAATMVALATAAILGRERLLRRAAAAWDGRRAQRLAWSLELAGGLLILVIGAFLFAGSF